MMIRTPKKGTVMTTWVDEEISTDVWWTKEMQPIPLVEMETSHIKNCIAMIEGEKNWRRMYLVPLKKELARRHSELGEILYGNGKKNDGSTV